MKVHAELEPWETQLIEHKGKHDVACSESKFLKEKPEAGRKVFKDAQHQMSTITEKIKEKVEFKNNIEIKIQQNKLEASEGHRTEQDCIKEKESLIPLEQAARKKVAEIRSVLESEKSQGSVLKAILQDKASGEIEGIYGRLGDLGAIDKKYDIAISTACAGLDYIVVETTAASQACVE